MSVTSVSGSRAEYWPDNCCSRWIWGDAKVRNNDFRIQLEMVLGTASRFCHPDFKIQMRSLGQFLVPEHEIMPIKYFFFKCRDVRALPGLWQPVLSEALHAALQTSRRYQTYSHLDNVSLVLKTSLSSKTFPKVHKFRSSAMNLAESCVPLVAITPGANRTFISTPWHSGEGIFSLDNALREDLEIKNLV